jgi:hypothetical protein
LKAQLLGVLDLAIHPVLAGSGGAPIHQQLTASMELVAAKPFSNTVELSYEPQCPNLLMGDADHRAPESARSRCEAFVFASSNRHRRVFVRAPRATPAGVRATQRLRLRSAVRNEALLQSYG